MGVQEAPPKGGRQVGQAVQAQQPCNAAALDEQAPCLPVGQQSVQHAAHVLQHAETLYSSDDHTNGARGINITKARPNITLILRHARFGDEV